jgi:hypothetical protein
MPALFSEDVSAAQDPHSGTAGIARESTRFSPTALHVTKFGRKGLEAGEVLGACLMQGALRVSYSPLRILKGLDKCI